MMTVGGFLANSRRRCCAAQDADELLVDDLHDLLGRVQRLVDLVAEGALAHLAGELLDDLERDVGVEQGAADLADGSVDIRRGELALGAEVAEGRGETIRERAECCHGANSLIAVAERGLAVGETQQQDGDAGDAARSARSSDDRMRWPPRTRPTIPMMAAITATPAPMKNSAMKRALSSSLPFSAAEMPLTKLKYISAIAPTASRMPMTAGAIERRSAAVWCEVSDMARSLGSPSERAR